MENPMANSKMSRIPDVTLAFWIVKIAATTLGETAGDAVSMSMDLGYLLGTWIFLGIFLTALFFQMRLSHFNPVVYWTTIIATTTVGTTLADFADRSLGIGYAGGSALLSVLLLCSFGLWLKTSGSVSVQVVENPRSEVFYWITILLSQTLGTALGDWMADSAGMGYLGSAALFGGLLALIALMSFWRQVSRTGLFWAAFILTRPLGAVVGDFLDKPLEEGGLALSRYTASAALLIVMVVCLFLFPSRRKKSERL